MTISELNSLPAASVTPSEDLLCVVDLSEDETKKITISEASILFGTAGAPQITVANGFASFEQNGKKYSWVVFETTLTV
jgi:hypothetical protein